MSSERKTPSVPASSSSISATYPLSFVATDSQDASSAIGVRNVVRTTSSSEIPSTPTWYETSRDGIQRYLLDELHARVLPVERHEEHDRQRRRTASEKARPTVLIAVVASSRQQRHQQRARRAGPARINVSSDMG